MVASVIAYTPGSGGKEHSESVTIGTNTGDAPYVLPFEYQRASYHVYATSVSIATAADHVLQIMAGSSLNVRLRYIRIEQMANATAVSGRELQILRLTTAGTGGTAITPAKADNGDAASGATAMTLPSAKGTEGTLIDGTFLIMRQAILATATQPEEAYEWRQHPSAKPIIIPSGTANGICIKNITATAGATVLVKVEFVETNY